MSPLARRALIASPLAVAAIGGAGFYATLRGLGSGSYDPKGVPSALLNKPVPDFSLPALDTSGLPGLSAADIRGFGRPVLVNYWASWCVPCIIEHPQLMRMKADGLPILGINYKDKPADAQKFLTDRGTPFTRLGRDEPGRVAIDWGVYGVPETYLIDREGIIRWRWAGPITPEVVSQDIATLLKRYA